MPSGSPDLPVLLVSSRDEIAGKLRAALPGVDLQVVTTPFDATAAVASGAYRVVVLEHPAMDMSAVVVVPWLRDSGACCPFVVLAEDATAEQIAELAAELGDQVAVVLDSIEPLIASIGRAGTAPAPEDDPALLAELGAAPIAIKLDPTSCDRWTGLSLPPQLIAILDGTRSAAEVVQALGDDTSALLRQLLDLDCIEQPITTIAPAPSAALTEPPPDGPPDRAGRLPDDDPVEILLELKRRGETGVVVLETDWRLRLDIAAGNPVGWHGGPVESLIGQTLVRLGHLDDRALATLLERHGALRGTEPALRLGEIAVRDGLIGYPQLHEGLEAQLAAKVEAFVTATHGSHRFWRRDQVRGWDQVEPQPLESLLALALGHQGEARRRLVERFLSRHGTDGVTAGADAPGFLPAFHLGPRAQRLLRQLDGRPVRDVIATSPMDEDETLHVIALLHAAGAIATGTLLDPSSAPPGIRAPAPRPAPPTLPPDATRASGRPRPVVTRTPPQEAHGDSRREAIAAVAVARAALDSKDYPRAIAHLRTARAASPDDPVILTLLGSALFRSQPGSEKVRAEARTVFRRALELDPRATSAVVGLAKTARLDGDLVEARRQIDGALEIDPTDAEVELERAALDKLEHRGDDKAPSRPARSGIFRALFGKRDP